MRIIVMLWVGFGVVTEVALIAYVLLIGRHIDRDPKAGRPR